MFLFILFYISSSTTIFLFFHFISFHFISFHFLSLFLLIDNFFLFFFAKVVFFAKTSELHVLNKAIIYARENELCDRIIICHVHLPHTVLPPGFCTNLPLINIENINLNVNKNVNVRNNVDKTQNKNEYMKWNEMKWKKV